MGNCLLTY